MHRKAKTSFDSPYCDTGFIAVVWNRTHGTPKVGLCTYIKTWCCTPSIYTFLLKKNILGLSKEELLEGTGISGHKWTTTRKEGAWRHARVTK